jgi:H/ACA ribonucleoprotein complex subunit 4
MPDDGFAVIDKPKGPSSHEVSAWVKIITGRKAGHAGTLDPQAIGVLPVAVGSAMKLLRGLAECDKEYVCIARFTPALDEATLRDAFREFTGKIYQTPPAEAAVKRVLRSRVIHSLKLLETDGELALFRVKCQHGTYIRVLCEDIGEVYGSKGEMAELRRTIAGPFTEKDAVFLQTLKDERKLIPVERAVTHLKRIVVGNNAVGAVCHGASLAVSGVKEASGEIAKGETLALFTQAGELIGLGEALMTSAEMGKAKSGLVAKPVSVVMPRDAYPRKWGKG